MLHLIRSLFLRKPVLPVTPEERAWIDARFDWLIGAFGEDRLRNGIVVLPTTQFFPGHYGGTEDEVHDLLVKVAQYMDVDPDQLRLKFYQENRLRMDGMPSEGTHGLYSEAGDSFYNIWIEVETAADPISLVATLAHEIGHVRLLGEGRVSPDEEDHEPLTDLLTVFLGLGIFTANTVLRESSWSHGTYSGWSMGRSGYLTMNIYGYAFARFALARGEISPAWLKYLRLDVRNACRQAMRFLTAEVATQPH